MLKRLAAISVFALIAACGSNSSKGNSNAAAGTTFTYGGTPSNLDGAQSASISSQMQTLTGAAGLPDATGAGSLQSFDSISGSLLGTNAFTEQFSKINPDSSKAVQSLVFKLISEGKLNPPNAIDPNCISATETSITFTNCTDTRLVEGGEVTVTLNGTLRVSGNDTAASIAWDFAIGLVATGTAAWMPANATFTNSGGITVTITSETAGTISGQELASYDVTATEEGQSVHAVVDESLDLNVQYDSMQCPESYIIDGTLEAKRVWEVRPQGYTETELPDVGVKVTWTRCGVGTFQYGTN